MTKNASVIFFSDLCVGQAVSFQQTVTEEMIDRFADLSGDYNPLHVDKDYAHSQDFFSRVMHGAFSAALVSRLIGMYLPGKFCILHRMQLSFVNPVYPGTALHVSGTLEQISEAVRAVVIKIAISDQNSGMCFARGTIHAGVLKEKIDV